MTWNQARVSDHVTWNHRVLRHTKKIDEEEIVWYGIHEVYYDENGRAHSCTMDSIIPCGETSEALAAELRMFLKACELPVLEFSQFERK